MNIAELLKICPKGTKLYSPLCGEVTLESVCLGEDCQIYVSSDISGGLDFTKDGKYFYADDAECLLFPSKDNRDWSTFVPPSPFKPFDKVVVKNTGDVWYCDIFSHYDEDTDAFVCIGDVWKVCLPYNEETAKLIGTTDDYKG